jgi:putative transposase
MLLAILASLLPPLLAALERTWRQFTRLPRASAPLALASDLVRSKAELVLENALLRQQLLVLQRQVKKPHFTGVDRISILLLARHLPHWKQALLILKPATLLYWHREAFRLFWKFKTRIRRGRPQLTKELIQLIQQMAKDNPLWGAERIRGELLKLGIRVAKHTIQTYMRRTRTPHVPTQEWSTFLKNHEQDIWACDFLPVIDLFFRHLFVFAIIELGSRRVVHIGVTRHPTNTWVTQQLREATPYGQAPRFLLFDNDSKYGMAFAQVAASTGIEVLRTPFRAPRANAVCERFLRSVRNECLDYMLILSEEHLYHVMREYVRFFNRARPHQGIDQRIPEGLPECNKEQAEGKIIAFPILNGLHHDYQRAA